MTTRQLEFNEDDVDSKFSVDLYYYATEHLKFIRSIQASGISQKTPSLESLKRYRDLWLPLVREHHHADLIPPADVAWLWHCHRLVPHLYYRYLQNEFGPTCPILNAMPPFSLQLPEALSHFSMTSSSAAAQTRELWTRKYPTKDFFLSEKPYKTFKKKKTNHFLINGFDMLRSTEQQAKFFCEVSDPLYLDHDYLKQGTVNYYNFLALQKTSLKQKPIPTLQIKFIWHTHMLASQSLYEEDCQAITGTVISYEDCRMEDQKLHSTGVSVIGNGKNNIGEPPKVYNNQVSSPGVAIKGTSSSAQLILWCWKETRRRMKHQDKWKVVGDPEDCWIQYDKTCSDHLERDFQAYGGAGSCLPMHGYKVEFSTMKQIKLSTGYERDVRRVTIVWAFEIHHRHMHMHILESTKSNSEILGNPEDCLIKFAPKVMIELENAFQTQQGGGVCSLSSGWVVDFGTMMYTAPNAFCERKVKRVPVDAAVGFDSAVDEETIEFSFLCCVFSSLFCALRLILCFAWTFWAGTVFAVVIFPGALLIFYAGPYLIALACVFDPDKRKIIEEYRKHGLEADGVLTDRWKQTVSDGSDSTRIEERCIVEYAYPAGAGDRFYMEIVVNDDIRPFANQGVVPLLVLPGYPCSGRPRLYTENLTCEYTMAGRLFFFFLGFTLMAGIISFLSINFAPPSEPNIWIYTLIVWYILAVAAIALLRRDKEKVQFRDFSRRVGETPPIGPFERFMNFLICVPVREFIFTGTF